ncbi:MAG: hypothetical protein MUC42_14900, partial [Bryobacter sp.]|nr:hypothetical protein [Bryobacter sp.]
MVLLCLIGLLAAAGPKFYDDDPLEHMPRPRAVGSIAPTRESGPSFSLRGGGSKPFSDRPAAGVNTLGEVPDNEWFVNRAPAAARQMGAPPKAPYLVLSLEVGPDRIRWRARDSADRVFLFEGDLTDTPGMRTGAQLIGSRLFHALGYSTPEVFRVEAKRTDFRTVRTSTVSGMRSGTRTLTDMDFKWVFNKLAQTADGYTLLAARMDPAGTALGPFKWEGTRKGDVNDIVPHEDRRDLRGLRTVAAWLNHAGPAPLGTLDTLVEENGVHFVRHHIVDFDGLFGCGSDPGPKAPPGAMELFSKIGQLGFQRTAGIPARYRCLGRIDSESFRPEAWEPVYAIGAFEQARPDDAFWAMRRIAGISDDQLRALVAAAGFSEAEAAKYLVETLAGRREKLARQVFARFLALDRFGV